MTDGATRPAGPAALPAPAERPAAGEPPAPGERPAPGEPPGCRPARLPVPVGRIAPRPVPAPRTPRVAQIIEAALGLLEDEGPESLTMRRVGEVLGIRAPSLYKHLPGKQAVETALIETALWELGEFLHRVVDDSGPSDVVARLLTAYRGCALDRPNLYGLATAGPIPREALTPGLEVWAGEPFYRATGEPHVAQALWAAAHGTVALELASRYLPGSDLARTWAALAAAFTRS